MTKKDFEAIAAIIRNRVEFLKDEPNYRIESEIIALDLAEYFTQVNPRFDQQRFITACGIK